MPPTRENLPRGSGDIPDVIAALRGLIAEALGTPEADLDRDRSLFALGMTSLHAIGLAAALARALGRPISPTLFWEQPTIAGLAAHIVGDEAPRPAASVAAPAGPEPVAIIGMACRFPQAPDLEGFWRLLADGVDATTEVPPDRWDAAHFHDPDPAAPGKTVTRRGAFLDDVRGFDPLAFGISPREADELDPQQRLALELSWEALEDAGLAPRGLAGRRVGVYFGSMWHDWADLSGPDLAGMSAHRATGSANNMIANRVSYVLGLRGPSLVLDTACSSALVAVHLAIQ
ncbi:MAG: polyketide synthase, partial [Myxococcales bacterium]|nr:polyketide synthase [Myxococcales bacterium]